MRVLISDLTRDQYTALGKVAVEWSHIEESLRELLGIVAGFNDQTTMKITAELGSVTLLDMLLAFAHNPDNADDDQPAIYQVIMGILPRITELRGKRNRLLHQAWLRSNRPGHMAGIRVDADGKLKAKFIERDATYMNQLCADIGGLYQKIMEITFDFREGRLVPPPPKSPKQSRPGRRNSQTTRDK